MKQRFYTLFITFVVIAIASCATTNIPISQRNPIYSSYPDYRIDDLVKKVILIPDDEFSDSLFNYVEETFSKGLETVVINC